MEPKPKDVSFSEGHSQEVSTRLLALTDLDAIRPILETWVRDSRTHEIEKEEIEQDLQNMRDSLNPGNSRTFFVAEMRGKVVGVVGMQPPEKGMEPFVEGCERPIQLVNAYVASDARLGKGVGRKLVNAVELEALQKSFSHVVINSGPRYEKTAWGFYDKLPDYQQLGFAKDHFGPGTHAKVWRKPLKK